MEKMTLLSYPEFSALRLSDYFEHGIEPIGLVDSAIGSADGECVGRHTHFLWKPDEHGDLAEIILELGGEDPCPPAIAARIMASLGVALSPNDVFQKVISAIGSGGLKIERFGAMTFIECSRGEAGSFHLALAIHEKDGLTQFHITRRDKK